MKRFTAILLGLGLVLFPVHNVHQPFLEYGVFIPHIALAMIALGLIFTLENNKWQWGNKWVYIPMLLIVASAWVRLIVDLNMTVLAGALMVTVLFAVYLATMILGNQILVAFLPALLIQVASVFVEAVMRPGQPAVGFISGSGNYDIAIGVMIFGALLIEQRGLWQILPLVIPAVIFTGAGEGLISLAILTTTAFIKRDWSKKAIPVLIAVTLVAAIGFWTGAFVRLYSWGIITVKTILNLEEFNQSIARATIGEHAFWGRIRVIGDSFQRFKIFGNGYEVVKFTSTTVHNVPLIIVDQLGIVAGLSWLFVSLYCLFKTKYTYLWVGILSLGLFDHFTWTQLAPWWWVAVAISTSIPKDSDYLFRSQKNLKEV